VLGEIMSSQRPLKSRVPVLTMHGWTAKHYVFSAVMIIVAVGMFAYSWS
jgi:hypothetical protein